MNFGILKGKIVWKKKKEIEVNIRFSILNFIWIKDMKSFDL